MKRRDMEKIKFTIIFKIIFLTFFLSIQLHADGYLDQFNNNVDCYSYENCGCASRFWGEAEYLYWKVKNSPIPVPLLVEGPVVPGGSPVLDLPDTKILLGDEHIKTKWRSGGRFTVGYWFNDSHCFGAEASYFFLAKDSKKQSASSDGSIGSPFLTIPFFDIVTSQESSTTVARPGVFQGKATLKLTNYMQGGELNALTSIPYGCTMNFGLLAGFRYWNFVEHLSFDTDSPFVPPLPLDIFQTEDKFHVRNNFYGGQIGAKLDYLCNKFFLNIKGKVALGAMYQKLDIHGNLLTNDFNNFGEPQSFPGGYLALPTNIGQHRRTRFSVIPEANINLGYQVTDCLRLQIGYNFIYVTNVLWAGKQIDRKINPSQSSAIDDTPTPILVGEERPKAKLKNGNLWVQGVSAGLEFSF